jgi:hypothetical protein
VAGVGVAVPEAGGGLELELAAAQPTVSATSAATAVTAAAAAVVRRVRGLHSARSPLRARGCDVVGLIRESPGLDGS